MFSILQLLALLVACLPPASPLASYVRCPATESTTISPPSQDPWYKSPLNYATLPPGTVLRLRLVAGNTTSTVANSSAVYNILYSTTDSHDRPSWAVTTFFVPLKAHTQTSSALLSYQIPYDSADVDSSPSYALFTDTTTYAFTINDISTALGRGWHVNVPDYEGPLASAGAGVQSGHATLDSIRAILLSCLGLDYNTSCAMWGYSGGALATGWAAELQPRYACELELRGAALGGLIPNLRSVMDSVTEHPYAGLIPEALLGLTTQWPKAYQELLTSLRMSGPYNASSFLAARNMTATQALATFANQSIYEYFEDGQAALEGQFMKEALRRDGIMGLQGVPTMPLFVYKAIADEVSRIQDTDELVRRYCDAGTHIIYQRNTIGEHLTEEFNGDTRAFEWLGCRLDETSCTTMPRQGCVVQNVTVYADT